MSDYPVVYGHCDAGCKRRVASYEEFLNSAAMAKIRPSGTGAYLLEQGRCYKIVDSSADGEWGFRINVVPLMKQTTTGYETAPITWLLDLPPFDIYNKFIKIRPLDFRFVETSITNEFNAEFVCEINDERQTLVYRTTVLLADYDLSTLRYEVRVSGATECYQYNTDATFKLSDTKSAYEYALDGGYTGTEEEFAVKLASENGVSSWNDLADKPFEVNEDGSVKYLDDKYLEFLKYDNGERTLLAEEDHSFTLDESFNAFGFGISPAPFRLIIGETYSVTWDGQEYSCAAQDVSEMFGSDAVGIGNLSEFGGTGNNEPFVAGWMLGGFVMFSMTDTAPTTHSVRIFQKKSEGYIMKNEYMPKDAAKIDLSAFESEGKVVEIFPDGTQKTTTIEFDESGNPVVITDADGNETYLVW